MSDEPHTPLTAPTGDGELVEIPDMRNDIIADKERWENRVKLVEARADLARHILNGGADDALRRPSRPSTHQELIDQMLLSPLWGPINGMKLTMSDIGGDLQVIVSMLDQHGRPTGESFATVIQGDRLPDLLHQHGVTVKLESE